MLQQKQRPLTEQAPRTTGELAIAVLDLLFGLPLALLMVIVLRPNNAPRDLATWLFAIPWLMIVAGLVSAGLLILLRHYRLARALQWVALLGVVLIGAPLAYTILQRFPLDQSLLLELGACLLAIATLIALPLWLKKLTED